MVCSLDVLDFLAVASQNRRKSGKRMECEEWKWRMIEANTILCGDCIQVMPQIPTGSVDFILTDPIGIKLRKDDKQGLHLTS
jgi:hypothetical protein